MSVWGIADLHLSLGVPGKTMELFGPHWNKWTDKIKHHWMSSIKAEDLVLIPGDISWAKTIDEAAPDFAFLDELPGTKLLLRGNHDYWWGSLKKIEAHLPPSLHLLQNHAFQWKDVSIAGSRLWDSPSYHCLDLIDFQEITIEQKLEAFEKESGMNKKIFNRELIRLELSLRELDPKAKWRLAMTHYPPLGPELKDSPVTQLFEKYQVNIALFGHLHQLKKPNPFFGEKNGIQYFLVSCDVIDFAPFQLPL